MREIEDSVHEIYKEVEKLKEHGCEDAEAIAIIKLAILNNISKDTSSIANSLSAMSFKDRVQSEDW